MEVIYFTSTTLSWSIGKNTADSVGGKERVKAEALVEFVFFL